MKRLVNTELLLLKIIIFYYIQILSEGIGMDSKILNIVTFTDHEVSVMGERKYVRKAAIFYDDGLVDYVSIVKAFRTACQTKIRISEITLDEFLDNYDNYRQIADFDFIEQDVIDVPPIEKKNFIVRTFGKITGFFKNAANKCYSQLEKLADWLTVHVVSKVDKKIKRIKTNRKNKKGSLDTDHVQQKNESDLNVGSFISQENEANFKGGSSLSSTNESYECTFDKGLNYGSSAAFSQQSSTFEYYVESLGYSIVDGYDSSYSAEYISGKPHVYVKIPNKPKKH